MSPPLAAARFRSSFDQAVEMAAPVVEGHRHEISLTLPPKHIRVEGDAMRLTQIVFNLINNTA